ncbi:lysine--tRNA ligase [Candidatus Woesebacteria bacterium]|nr:lysine--tRNA ligase [Candidatus Woesebacteria bacterium]MCD8527235.1 lysine--tRNA ligase [Candidatus Woesebacteria bacterium]MCD8546601.1 lysine--tRNA ligase [Candidatus Woesebacteria bacterium]
MASRLEEMMQARRDVREDMLQNGTNPYPQEGHRTHTNQQALDLADGKKATIAGRVRAMRGHGKIRFVDVHDEFTKIQVVFKQDETADFAAIKNFHTGDFIRVTGERFTTNAGEASLLAREFDMLSKALRPLPDSWYGFSDEEERYRRRPVDLIMNPDVAEVFRQRSKIIQSVRQTLDEHNFLEVETPTLQPMYGGANARPFVTHINAWDIPQYLKISDELYLKRLIVGGFERVYEIDKDFRNEGVDRTHNPEFTMMECYAAYWDYNDMMTLTEKVYENAAIAIHGTTEVEYQGMKIDFRGPWRRLPMKDAIREYLGIDVDELSDDELRAAIKDHKLEYEGEWIRGLGIATLFEAVEEHLIQPVFITDMPRETTSLCKPHREDASLIERFEPYIAGWEVGNAYTELNDPVLQRQFWEEERDDDDEAHPLDEDFIETLEYGMPPTGGLGMGLDRMVMLLTNQTKIRDVILFPTMKPRE